VVQSVVEFRLSGRSPDCLLQRPAKNSQHEPRLFRTREVLGLPRQSGSAGYDAPRAQTFQDELLERVKALPGVELAAFARMTPLSYGSYSSSLIAIDGYQPPTRRTGPWFEYNESGPGIISRQWASRWYPAGEFSRADDEKAALVAIVK